MDEPQTSYKWCIVPKCKITSIKNPEKAFINVPKDEKIRKKWMNAIRRDPKDISVKTVCFVCEDHFDLENDLENYMKWKLVGGKKMLKKGVTPHKFDCQIDRKVAFTHVPRQSGIKRARMELIQAAEESYSTVDEDTEESVASRMFRTSVLIISNVLRDMIIWPSADLIKRNLPIAFRARFGKVQAVIDCFEIEIQKPSDAIKQALTWSEYKKANTLKYLISSTPDGIINFVSPGYGGRTSDTVIVETCGFLEKVVAGKEIMADRGFKHIDMLVESKGGKLVRPPSVEAGTKMSEAQVLETKRIASLRIHIERVIRRMREFKILKPHSCIDHKLIPYTDAIIFIVCGLINTQPPLIKKV